TPTEIYNHPANTFVARFLGLTNIIPVLRIKNQDSTARMETAAGTFILQDVTARSAESRFILLRPRAIERIVSPSERGENILRGRVTETQLRGGHQRILVETRAGKLTFEWDGQVHVGQEATFALARDKIALLKE